MEYDIDGKSVVTHWIAVKNQKIRDFRNSKEVNILVNPNKVKQAIVIDAFNFKSLDVKESLKIRKNIMNNKYFICRRSCNSHYPSWYRNKDKICSSNIMAGCK